MSPWQVQISSNLISQGFWWSVRWTVPRTYPFTDGSQWEHGEFPWSYLIARGYQSPFGCLHSEDFWSFLLKSTYSGQSPINWALNEKLIYKMVDFQLPRLIAGGCVLYIYIWYLMIQSPPLPLIKWPPVLPRRFTSITWPLHIQCDPRGRSSRTQRLNHGDPR